MEKKHLFLVALAALVIDQLSKNILLSTLGVGARHNVVSIVSISVSINKGIVFGLFEGANVPLAFLTMAVLGLMLFYYDKIPKKGHFALSFGLILGGGLGNLIDRLAHGGVVDFIDLKFWPVFNIADAAITAGVAIAIYSLWKE